MEYVLTTVVVARKATQPQKELIDRMLREGWEPYATDDEPAPRSGPLHFRHGRHRARIRVASATSASHSP